MLLRYVEVADTSWSRLKGLLGRRFLNHESGLWIVPSSGVHTLGMQFAIDVIGLDRNGVVRKLWPKLQKNRMTNLVSSVATVLETAEGTIDRTGIRLGDQLEMRDVETAI